MTIMNRGGTPRIIVKTMFLSVMKDSIQKRANRSSFRTVAVSGGNATSAYGGGGSAKSVDQQEYRIGGIEALEAFASLVDTTMFSVAGSRVLLCWGVLEIRARVGSLTWPFSFENVMTVLQPASIYMRLSAYAG